MLAVLARRIARRPALVVAAWAVLVVAGFAASSGVVGEGLFGRLTSGEGGVPGEAHDGRVILSDHAPYGPSLTLLLDGVSPLDPAVRGPLATARTELQDVPGVARVSDPLAAPGGPRSPAGAALVAADGRAFLVTVDLDRGLPDAAQKTALDRVENRLGALGAQVAGAVPGARGSTGGVTLLVEAITDQVEVDLRTGEGIALPVSLAVMVFVFGGFLAAGLPLAGALAAVAGALVTLLGFSYVIDLDASVVNVVTVLGLGLCIDYGLLMVSRFRDEMRARGDSVAALEATLGTAGRTVAFSALTVAISLSGLLAFSAEILRAIGAAGVSVVLLAMAVALTLVPAVLALAGERLLRPGLPSRVPLLRRAVRRFGDVAPPEGFFSRLARRTQRHPVLVLAGVLAVLLLAAAPVLQLQLRSSGTALLPVSSPQRQFFDTLDARFPAAALPQVQVVARTSTAGLQPLARRVQQLPGVRSVTPPDRVGASYAAFSVVTDDRDPAGPAARGVVADVRGDRPGYPTWVTGQTAQLVDFVDSAKARAPWAAGLVVLATFVLLFLMTGSLLVPLKALAMNVVSLGASLGVLVWVFQEGHLEGLLGYTSTGGIETTIPPLVLAFGFGLAMDYEVFLLSRVKEMRDAGLGNDAAVVAGLQRSGRIITSAALIIVLVFSGFVAGQLLVIKQTGVALAVAVAIDATLVRCLLVPATMTLLGEWNWWAPRSLRRLHSRVGLRESGDSVAHGPGRYVARHSRRGNAVGARAGR